MLQYQTVEPTTLELIKELQSLDIDLYFPLQHFSFQKVIELYKTKYPDAIMFTTLKSLVYFEDAEPEPMPYMLENVSWEQVKTTISKLVQR